MPAARRFTAIATLLVLICEGDMEAENIEVEAAAPVGEAHQVVITDRKSGRAWSGEGKSHNEAATQAVRRLLGDRRTHEYLPR